MKIQKGTALWRGIIAAAVGFVAMLCLMLALGQFSFLYLLAGPFYGFGFAFANWHVVMQKTKQGAIQGAAVFGIGLVLSHWLKDQRYGMWGWLFFVFRVSWHLGFCWIPGIWYGIQAIREEARGTAPASVSDEDLEARQLDQQRIARAAAIQAAPVPQAVPVSRPAAVSRPAPTPQPAAPSKQTQPSLDCVAGAFAGARFPVSPGEILSGQRPCALPDCTAPTLCCFPALLPALQFEPGLLAGKGPLGRTDVYQWHPASVLRCLPGPSSGCSAVRWSGKKQPAFSPSITVVHSKVRLFFHTACCNIKRADG